jgi:hypothetical protein
VGDWTVTVRGANEFEAVMKRAGDRAIPSISQALFAELTLVMLESQHLGYGGAASIYAPIVHNMPRIMHPTKPGTKSHFLSDPLKAALPNMESRLAERIERLTS